jgi:hypothetical protein
VVLPAAPNAIYLSQVNSEFGSAFNTPITLNDADVRRFAKGVATYYVHTPVYGSAIYMSELRGKDLGSTTIGFGPGTHTFTTPLHATLTVDVYGGGGGGGGGASRILWYNQAGNLTTSTRSGSPGGAGGASSFGGILVGNGGGGGGAGVADNALSPAGAVGTAGGGNATNGGAANGGAVGQGAFAFWGGGAGGAGGRAWYTWPRGTFYAPGTLITITVGGGGGGGAQGPDGSPYSGASYLDTYNAGSPGGAGGNGAVYISWT